MHAWSNTCKCLFNRARKHVCCDVIKNQECCANASAIRWWKIDFNFYYSFFDGAFASVMDLVSNDCGTKCEMHIIRCSCTVNFVNCRIISVYFQEDFINTTQNIINLLKSLLRVPWHRYSREALRLHIISVMYSGPVCIELAIRRTFYPAQDGWSPGLPTFYR